MSLCSDQKCVVVGNPYDGLEVTTITLHTLTKVWDVRLPSGAVVAAGASRLKPVDKRSPIQTQFTDWGKA